MNEPSKGVPIRRRFWNQTYLVLLCIALFAFGLRVAHLIQIEPNPFFDHPILDAAAYDNNAWALAQGKPTSDDGLAYYQAPLYTFFLSAVYRVFGHEYFAARVVQAFLSSLSCVLLFLLGARLFNRRTGLLAAAIYACYGPLIFYDGALLKPALVIFLNLSGLLLLLMAVERRHWILFAISGAVFGLSSLTRENILLFVPFVLWWIYLSRHRARKRGIAGTWAASMAAFLFAMALVIAPVTLRNYVEEEDVVLVSKVGGLNFYIGNSERSDHYLSLQPGHRWQQLSTLPDRIAGHGKLKSSERSAIFFEEAFSFIASHPMQWLRLMFKKTLIFWNGAEFDPNHSIAYIKSFSDVLRHSMFTLAGITFPFGLVIPLALVGFGWVLFGATGGRRIPALLMAFYVIACSVGVVLFLVKARYRLPMVPVMILFAADGFFRIFESFREKKYRIAAAHLFLVGLLVFLCNFPFVNADSRDYFPLHYYLARTHIKNQNYDKAAVEYAAAIRKDPQFAEARNELAHAYMRLGKLNEAEKECKKALELAPAFSEVHAVMGIIYQKTGRDSLALFAYRKALQHAGKLTDISNIQTNMAMILFQQGRMTEAAHNLLRARQHKPSLKIDRLLQMCYRALDRDEQTRAAIRRALQVDPTPSITLPDA